MGKHDRPQGQWHELESWSRAALPKNHYYFLGDLTDFPYDPFFWVNYGQSVAASAPSRTTGEKKIHTPNLTKVGDLNTISFIRKRAVGCIYRGNHKVEFKKK